MFGPEWGIKRAQQGIVIDEFWSRDKSTVEQRMFANSDFATLNE